MQYELIEKFFEDLSEYMRFFLNLKEQRRESTDSSCLATLRKEENKYLYLLEFKDGRYVGEYVRPFRPNEQNLQLFNSGCKEVARRLNIYIQTSDLNQVPMKPPAFGILSCESPDELIPAKVEKENSTVSRKYFPVWRDARLVKRYDAESYQVILLTDVKCVGIIRCTHLLIALNKREKVPNYVIAAEVNNLGDPKNGSHFLGCYPGSGHINFGCSNDWGDLSLFEKKALELMSEELGVLITEERGNKKTAE